jgi:hypothetical protein
MRSLRKLQGLHFSVFFIEILLFSYPKEGYITLPKILLLIAICLLKHISDTVNKIFVDGHHLSIDFFVNITPWLH